jgi:16S rRNA (cytosine967-C5)-methyltransferase
VRLETERGRRLDRAFGEAASSLEPRERAFAHELSFGVTRLRGRLDHLLAPHFRRGFDSVDATVLELLRAGVYQMFYMGSVPPYAAVSATVDHVREAVAAAPAGFANAVLRKVQSAGDGPDRFPSEKDDPLGFLTHWGAHPEWLIRRWLDRWSPADVRRLVEADNTPPATYLTPLGLEPVAAVEVLAAAGIAASVVGRGTGCVRLDERGDVVGALTALPDSVVQDPAANLVTRYADVPSGTMVADLCAAPGGKALALSARPADILAADRSESRIRMVRENVRRTGRSVAVVVADALRPPILGADVVLLDTPCTGTGTLARHPDARWRLAPESIGELAGVQDGLLQAAADVVVPGGLLVYSTCTLEPEENERRISAFLESHEGFELEASDAVPEEFLDATGCLTVTPHAHGFDGAFAARMRRAL